MLTELRVWWHQINAEHYQQAIDTYERYLAIVLCGADEESRRAAAEYMKQRDRHIAARDYHWDQHERLISKLGSR